jgi:hypothetical protein
MPQAWQVIVTTGIAVLLPILVGFGVNLVEPYPQIERNVIVTVRIARTTPEGWKAWDEENEADKRREQERRQTIDDATRPFYRLLIFVAAPIGIAAILVGSYLKIAAVGTGLIFGGALTILYGYGSYWEHLDTSVRVVSVLAGLSILIFLAYRSSDGTRNPPT